MSDAQSSTSPEPTAADAPKGAEQASRFFMRYIVLAILMACALVWAVPDLRTQVFHFDSVAAQEADVPAELPAAVAAKPAPQAQAVAVAVPVKNSRDQAVAFIETMGDGQPARKLPIVKVSARQADTLSHYIANKYRVSNEATRMLISTAYGVGQEMHIDPLLLLAIMAIESSFNPFAESNVGAQGLMQVLTKVHTDRFRPYGGAQAAWNPVANIRVGTSILKEYIARSGSVMGGLRMYVGVSADGSSPYGEKVLAERRRLASLVGAPAVLPHERPPAPAPEQIEPADPPGPALDGPAANNSQSAMNAPASGQGAATTVASATVM